MESLSQSMCISLTLMKLPEDSPLVQSFCRDLVQNVALRSASVYATASRLAKPHAKGRRRHARKVGFLHDAICVVCCTSTLYTFSHTVSRASSCDRPHNASPRLHEYGARVDILGDRDEQALVVELQAPPQGPTMAFPPPKDWI